jgi:hypothetical protein
MERQMEGKKRQKEEEASDCTLWGTCFGRGYEPDVIETMKLMNKQVLFKDTIVMRCQKEIHTFMFAADKNTKYHILQCPIIKCVTEFTCINTV